MRYKSVDPAPWSVHRSSAALHTLQVLHAFRALERPSSSAATAEVSRPREAEGAGPPETP